MRGGRTIWTIFVQERHNEDKKGLPQYFTSIVVTGTKNEVFLLFFALFLFSFSLGVSRSGGQENEICSLFPPIGTKKKKT